MLQVPSPLLMHSCNLCVLARSLPVGQQRNLTTHAIEFVDNNGVRIAISDTNRLAEIVGQSYKRYSLGNARSNSATGGLSNLMSVQEAQRQREPVSQICRIGHLKICDNVYDFD